MVKDAQPQTDWKQSVVKDTSSIARKGYTICAATLGIFILWALFFPIAGAVVTEGKVKSFGQNKLLQHPTGGVIKQIFARDGSILKKGELVLSIQPEAAVADLTQLSVSRDLLLAQKSRLMASKSGGSGFGISFLSTGSVSDLRGSVGSDGSRKKIKPKLASDDIYIEQEAQFKAGKRKFDSELSALRNQLFGLSSEAIGVQEQIYKNEEQLQSINQQVNKMRPLANSGYIAKTRLWDVETRQRDVESLLASLSARHVSLNSNIDEVQNKVRAFEATKKQDESIELTEVLSQLASIEERMAAAQKQVDYSKITAPASGVLTNLSVNTVGGYLQAGAIIAEIVPEDQPLEIEARIMPTDIGSLSIGQPAKITITAFNARLIDQLDGDVTYVSADSMLDENTGEPYFTARLSIVSGDAELQDTLKQVKAGMYAQVFIQTESRSFMSYVLTPMTDSFRKAFNES